MYMEYSIDNKFSQKLVRMLYKGCLKHFMAILVAFKKSCFHLGTCSFS